MNVETRLFGSREIYTNRMYKCNCGCVYTWFIKSFTEKEQDTAFGDCFDIDLENHIEAVKAATMNSRVNFSNLGEDLGPIPSKYLK